MIPRYFRTPPFAETSRVTSRSTLNLIPSQRHGFLKKNSKHKAEVGSVIWVLYHISYAFQQCKDFENRLRFDEVTDN